MKLSIILPNILLTSAKDEKVRQRIVENNQLERVYAIPRDLFPDTGATVSYWVLNNRKEDKIILFANSFEEKPIEVNNNKVKQHDYLFLPSLYTFEDEPAENPKEIKEKIKQTAKEVLNCFEEMERSQLEIKKILGDLVENGEI